jgi:hypothetical protein
MPYVGGVQQWQVTPGSTFDVYVEVTQAGSPFDGFDAVVGFDPAALTPGAHAETPYMTGVCGNTFPRYTQLADRDSFTDVLICGGPSLTGPGQIYHLQFVASSTPQQTTLHFLPGTRFYKAGIYVNPVTMSDAYLGIGMPPAGVEPSMGPLQLSLRAAPNPTRGGLVFTVESGRTGPETLTVFDVQGRIVRRLGQATAAAGVHAIPWDGRSEAGVKLSPGMYLVKLEVAGRSVWSRITMLQ